MPSTDPLPRSDQESPELHTLLRQEPARRITGRNRSKAAVLLYRQPGAGVAVKSYADSPFLIRNLLGRWLIAREAAAYRAVAGIAGLPRFLGRIGPFALATEWVDAEPLAGLRDQGCDAAVFDRIAVILQELHGRGVALGDLHHRDVLLAGNGEVYLIDLATAWRLGARPGRLRLFLFERFCGNDQVSLARLRARFTGGDVDAAVAAVGGRAATWHRRGRRIKAVINRLRGKRQ